MIFSAVNRFRLIPASFILSPDYPRKLSQNLDQFLGGRSLGELDIQISQNSTNGLDGEWTNIIPTIPGDIVLPNNNPYHVTVNI
jgi:hypothetical protein